MYTFVLVLQAKRTVCPHVKCNQIIISPDLFCVSHIVFSFLLKCERLKLLSEPDFYTSSLGADCD